MHHLDLFSGIGGFALGLESTGHYETGAFCEIEEFPRKVLRKHWPGVKIYHDINHHGWVSMSRFIDGRETDRAKWEKKQFDIQPNWLVIENEGHRWRKWVPELRRAVHDRGYSSLPLRVRADSMGFPHRRARVFIVAHADSLKLRELQRWWLGEGREVAAELARPEDYTPRGLGTYDGLPGWVDRRRALGNAVIPQIVAVIGEAIWRVENG